MNTKRTKLVLEEVLIASRRSKSSNSAEANSSNISEDYSSYIGKLLTSPSKKSNELINSIYESGTTISNYLEYKDLMKDPILKSALQLYADDVSNISSRDDIRVICDDTIITSRVDEYLNEKLKIDSEKLWTWAFNLVVFGDIYVERFHNEDGNLLDDVMLHQHPEFITDIRTKGESLIFIEKVTQDTESEYILNNSSVYSMVQSMDNVTFDRSSIIHDRYKYVHGALKGTFESTRIKLEEEIVNESTGEVVPNTSVIRTYEIVKGESLLENVKYIYRIIKLIEDALWMARLQNSQRIDILNIDLGDRLDDKTTPESVSALYKELINRQITVNYDSTSLLNSGSNVNSINKVNKAASLANLIINPVYKGRGSISHDLIDGTMDVSGIKDLEYFNNKLFAGLRIPKPMLGWEESLGSALGSGKMEELDKRYHRSVVRVTSVIESVLTQLSKLYLDELGFNTDSISLEITVHNKARDMTERYEEMQGQLDSVEPIISIINDYILNRELPINERMIYLTLYKNIFDPSTYANLDKLLKTSVVPALTDPSMIRDITDILESESDNDYKKLVISSYRSIMSDEFYNEIMKYVDKPEPAPEPEPEPSEDDDPRLPKNN